MTPGLGFALVAMLCFGVSDLIYKRATAAGIQAKHFAMLQAWVFCPGVTLYAWLTGTLQPHASALWGSLAGVFLVVAVHNFLASLKTGTVSTNAPIFRLNFTITAALAVLLLGETLTPRSLRRSLAPWWRYGCCSPSRRKTAVMDIRRASADRDCRHGPHKFLL